MTPARYARRLINRANVQACIVFAILMAIVTAPVAAPLVRLVLEGF